jgi:precorrin-6Y C5,15-methyltransferase (decarboxylating)
MIARNADRLGVPQLQVVTGDAPAALDALPDPDVVFVGGGVASDGLLDTCWRRLKPGGRLVANAVTIEGIGRLAQFRAEHGGDMVRLAVSRADAVGAASAFRPAMEVTQIVTVKP